jgi:putative flippase GtrA
LDPGLRIKKAVKVKNLLSSKIIRYASVGVVTLCVYLIAGAVLYRLDFSINWVATLSFTAAVAVNYVLQKMWVFQDSRPVIASLPKYFIMILVGYVTNGFALNASISQFPLPVAQLLAASAVVISNALFLFLWVFAIKSERKL